MTVETLTIAHCEITHETKMVDDEETTHIYSDGNYGFRRGGGGYPSFYKIDYTSKNPSICLSLDNDGKYEFSIQSSQKSTVSSEEVDEMIEGYHNAQHAIKWLSELI